MYANYVKASIRGSEVHLHARKYDCVTALPGGLAYSASEPTPHMVRNRSEIQVTAEFGKEGLLPSIFCEMQSVITRFVDG